MSTFTTIREYLSHATGKIPDVCSDFYFTYLKDNDNSSENFQAFMELWDEVSSDESVLVNEYFSEEEYNECFKNVEPIVEAMHSNLINKNEVAESFYSNLWESIRNTAFFATDIETICAIIHLVFSPLTPYYQMDTALSMDDDEYKLIASNINSHVKKAIFSLNRGYEQRTQVASQIISIFNSIDNINEKVVYVAQLIGYTEAKLARLSEIVNKHFSESSSESN